MNIVSAAYGRRYDCIMDAVIVFLPPSIALSTTASMARRMTASQRTCDSRAAASGTVLIERACRFLNSSLSKVLAPGVLGTNRVRRLASERVTMLLTL